MQQIYAKTHPVELGSTFQWTDEEWFHTSNLTDTHTNTHEEHSILI